MEQSESGTSLKRILVVDDQPANLASLQQILSDRYRISLAENGRVCLDFCEHMRPDLILLDVDMPVMDGLSVCRRLKSDQLTSTIPIIFVSALSRLEERLEGYRAGADDYVTKPYDVDELLVKIRIALNNGQDLEAARQRTARMRGDVEDTLSACYELDELRSFIDDTLDCQDLRSLGERVLETCDRFGLRVIVRMLDSGHYFSHAGEVGALDQEMMEAMYDKGRIIDFGHRTLINTSKVSVLVRNMPVHDAIRYRRWREGLSLLVSVLDDRVAVAGVSQPTADQGRLQGLLKGLSQIIEYLQDPMTEVDQEQTLSHLKRLIVHWEGG